MLRLELRIRDIHQVVRETDNPVEYRTKRDPIPFYAYPHPRPRQIGRKLQTAVSAVNAYIERGHKFSAIAHALWSINWIRPFAGTDNGKIARRVAMRVTEILSNTHPADIGAKLSLFLNEHRDKFRDALAQVDEIALRGKTDVPFLEPLEELVEQWLRTRFYPASERFETFRKCTKGMAQLDDPFNIQYCSAIDEYVAYNPDFVSSLKEIVELIEGYTARKTSRPLNIFLGAGPGAGKSYLVKRCRETLRKKGLIVEPREVRLDSLKAIGELEGIFQDISEVGSVPFVLFDEVDSLVSGESALPRFLSPMWDGKYHTSTQIFEFEKAVFWFAASSLFASPRIEEVEDRDYWEFARKWRKKELAAVCELGLPKIMTL